MDVDTDQLLHIPLFALLDDDERACLKAMAVSVRVAKYELVYSLGDPADSFYIVRSGKVQTFVEDDRGASIVVAENVVNDSFGELSLLDAEPRTTSAVAAEESDLLMLDRDDLLELVSKHPSAALKLLTVVGRRLRASNEFLRTHSTQNLNREDHAVATVGQRIGDFLTARFGSWPFLVLIVTVMCVALTFNDEVRAEIHEFGSIQILNLFLTILLVIQVGLILLAQNRQRAKDRLKAEIDYRFSLKTELALDQLSRILDVLREDFTDQDSRRSGIDMPKATSPSKQSSVILPPRP